MATYRLETVPPRSSMLEYPYEVVVSFLHGQKRETSIEINFFMENEDRVFQFYELLKKLFAMEKEGTASEFNERIRLDGYNDFFVGYPSPEVFSLSFDAYIQAYLQDDWPEDILQGGPAQLADPDYSLHIYHWVPTGRESMCLWVDGQQVGLISSRRT